MTVVADTTPINYLVLIDEVELLPALFERVLMPVAAASELKDPAAPAKVRQWFTVAPAWLEVRTAAAISSPVLDSLDPGERESIQLALDLGISTVLLDEYKARTVARTFDLQVRGTLGILERGAQLGKADFRAALQRLERTSFRLSNSVRAEFMERNP